MIFNRPVSFIEALQERRARLLLPNDLSSEELSKIDAGFREKSIALARVDNAVFLQAVDSAVEQIKDGELTNEVARRKLQELLDSMGYEAPDGARGLQNLRSDGRILLVLRTLVGMAGGYGAWRQGQNKAVLAAFPAQEFYRAAQRKEPRDWPERWAELGGKFYPGRSDYAQGRMIAAVNDPIWEKLSRFGLPYAPFDFNSGMDLRRIARPEAIQLGVITKEQADQQPQSRNFNDDFGTSTKGFTPEVLSELLDSLGDDFKVVDDVLVKANESLIWKLTNELLIANISMAQRRAGNYAKKHIKRHGLDISIENEKGSTREGIGDNGNPYKTVMPADYGYIKRTVGADKDQVDCFVGTTPSGLAFVIDQRNLTTKEFDEHKCFIDFPNAETARRVYFNAYPDGRAGERLAGFQTFTIPQFKAWLKVKARTKRPVNPERFA